MDKRLATRTVPVYGAFLRAAKYGWPVKLTYEAFMCALFAAFVSPLVAITLWRSHVVVWWSALAIGPAVYIFCAMVERHDERAFRLLWLWIRTALRNPLYAWWKKGSSSMSPFRRRRY